MSSSRLPGKALVQLDGRPALELLIERLEEARELDHVGVATSGEAEDDAIEAFCAEREVRCHRGPLDDLAARVLEAADAFELDALVRVNADSPLLDPTLVDLVARQIREDRWDLVTNVFPRSFPVGQSVEAILTDALRQAVGRMTSPAEREHVTRWFYENADEVRIKSVRSDEGDWSAVSLALDTPEDLVALEAIVRRIGARQPRPRWRELAEMRVSA